MPVATGGAAPSNPPVTARFLTVVTVDGTPAAVQFNGLTPSQVGLWQINFAIPSVGAGNRPLVITVGGISSPAVTVSISN